MRRQTKQKDPITVAAGDAVWVFISGRGFRPATVHKVGWKWITISMRPYAVWELADLKRMVKRKVKAEQLELR